MACQRSPKHLHDGARHQRNIALSRRYPNCGATGAFFLHPDELQGDLSAT